MAIPRLIIVPALAMALSAGVAAAGERRDNADAGRFVPPPAKEGYSYPDCYCTDSDGRRVEMGERACLRIGSRRVTARCGMSQNSPAWRTEAEGCPVS